MQPSDGARSATPAGKQPGARAIRDNGGMKANDPVPMPVLRITYRDSLDPNDSDMELDQLRGQTKLHAKPPRLEDEGQPGG